MREMLARIRAAVTAAAHQESSIVGKWQADPGADFAVRQLPDQHSELIAMIAKMEIEFRADSTYTFIMTAAGITARFEGVYVMRGRSATLTTTSVNGRDSKHIAEGVSSTTPARADWGQCPLGKPS
jgi:hypothetical protein